MTTQLDLAENGALGGQCSRGWGTRCAASQGKRCRCACGGANHGRARSSDGATQSITPEKDLYYAWDEPRRLPDLGVMEAGALTDERVVRFTRITNPGAFGDVENALVHLVGREYQEPLPHRYVTHSPTGLEWGYGGSGPADTALNILALLIPVKEATRRGMYQDFKFAFVARVPRDGGEIKLSDVRLWIVNQYMQQAVGGAV